MYFGAAAIAAGTQNQVQKSKFGENRVRMGLTKYRVDHVGL